MVFKANMVRLKIKSMVRPEFVVIRAIIQDYRDTFRMVSGALRRRKL